MSELNPTTRSSYSYKYYGYHGYHRDPRPRTLNRRLVWITILFLILATPSVYFWHQYQLKRLSSALLTRAESMEKVDRWKEASDLHFRYWKIQRTPESLGKLAQAYDRYAVEHDPIGVVQSYQRAVGLLPERIDLRNRLAELLAQDGQYSPALKHVDEILKVDPNNKEALKTQAISLMTAYRQGHQEGSTDQLVERIHQAWELQPSDLMLGINFANLLRGDLRASAGSEWAGLADRVINRIVELSGRNPYGYLARHQYRKRFELPQPEDDLTQALKLAPENPIVVRQAAEDAFEKQDFLTARGLYQRLVKLIPDAAPGYLGLGEVELVVHGPQRALEVWQQGNVKAPGNVELLLKLAEAQIELNQLDTAEVTLQGFDEIQSSLASHWTESQRSWALGSAALIRGRLLTARQQPQLAMESYRAAATLTQNVIWEGEDPKEPLAYLAWVQLGDGQAKLGEWENAANSYERALAVRPTAVNTLLASAKMWSKLGNVERAVRRTVQALDLPHAPSIAWLEHAQYLFQREYGMPVSQRNWSDFESALQTAREKLPQDWRLELLQLDFDLARQAPVTQALAKLSVLEQQFDANVEFRQLLPKLYEQLGDSSQADAALNRLNDLTSSGWQVKVLSADHLLGRGQPSEAMRVLDGIAVDSLSPLERESIDVMRLQIHLALLNQLRGESDERTRVLEGLQRQLWDMVQKYPKTKEPIAWLLDLHWNIGTLLPSSANLAAANLPTDAVLVDMLKSRDGETGMTWPYFAARLALQEGSSGENKGRELLDQLKVQRPFWARTHELEARLEGIRNGLAKGIPSLITATSFQLDVDVPLHMLLSQYEVLGQYRAIEHAVLRRTQRVPSFLIETPWNAMGCAGQTIHLPIMAAAQTLPAPEETVPAEVTKIHQNAIDRLWTWLQAQPGSPLQAKLLEDWIQATTSQDPLPFMLQLAAASQHPNRSAEADRILDQVQKLSFTDPSRKDFVLGQAYATRGLWKQALTTLDQVETQSPHRITAELLMGEVQQAINLEVEAHARERHANRGFRADPGHFRASEKNATLRLEAILKLRRAGQQDLIAARELLQQLVESPLATPNDRLLLASCYERLGDIPLAREQFSRVVQEDRSAHHLTMYADFLLKQNQLDQAAEQLTQLESQSPDASQTMALRVRLLDALGDKAKIIPFVERYAEQQIQRIDRKSIPQLMHDIAAVYQRVGILEESDRWMRQLAERFPQEHQLLAQLTTEGDVTEQTMEVIMDRFQNNPTEETAILLARALAYGKISSPVQAKALAMIDASASQFSQNPAVLFAIGNLRLKLGQPDAAIRLLTQVTVLQPGHYLAWNNLAFLLSEEPGRVAEAMTCINQAIQQAGVNLPTLWDTKASVLMHQKEYKEAADVFQKEVIAAGGNDPRFYLHYAIALVQLEKFDEAKRIWNEARDLGVEQAFLTQVERSALDQLNERFSDNLSRSP